MIRYSVRYFQHRNLMEEINPSPVLPYRVRQEPSHELPMSDSTLAMPRFHLLGTTFRQNLALELEICRSDRQLVFGDQELPSRPTAEVVCFDWLAESDWRGYLLAEDDDVGKIRGHRAGVG